MIQAGQPANASDFINNSERDATPANDAGKVVKLEADAKISPSFIQHAFGGDGSDGDLIVSSGTTSLDCGTTNKVKIFNFKSISITGTGKVNFINTYAGDGQIIVMRCQGDCVLTSSQTPMLDASGLGGYGSENVMAGNNGPNIAPAGASGFGAQFINTVGGAGNGAGTAFPAMNTGTSGQWWNDLRRANYPFVWGGGGGSGGGIYASYPPTTSGSVSLGGKGGGCLIMEIAGYFNFTTTGGISVAGKNGGNGNDVGGGGTANFGGAGGGGGGLFMAIYNFLTANTGTVDVAGGGGGSGLTRGSPPGSKGGGGGSSLITAGGAGGSSSGGGGGAGLAVFQLNTEIV